MKVTLISPNSPPGWDFGIRTLSAVLKREGHEVRLVFVPLYAGQQTVNSRSLEQTAALSAGSDLVGVSSMTNSFSGMAVIVRMLKEKLSAPILWGGMHPTLRPEECLKHADMVCVGEGEETVMDVVRSLEKGCGFGDVLGLGYKDNGTVVMNDPRPAIQDLDMLPYPDYDCADDWLLQDGPAQKIDTDLLAKTMTGFTHTSKERYTTYHAMTSRGCRFACAYCCNRHLRKMSLRQEVVRRRSVENVIGEFVRARRTLPSVNCMLINDDDFFSRDEAEIFAFAKEYEDRVRLPLWITGVNISSFSEKKFSRLVDAGLRFVRLGIQSGSERTRKMYRRHYSNQQVLAVAGKINSFRHKIAPPSYDIILDNPWESEADLTETLMLLSNLPKPYGMELFSLTFYPETELYDRAKKEGLIKNDVAEIYDRSYYAVRPTYLNKLFQLHLDRLSKGGAGISPGTMSLLTNPWLRRLQISPVLYHLLKLPSRSFREPLSRFSRKLRKIAPYVRKRLAGRPYLFGFGSDDSRIHGVNIEFVNYCNLRCKWCALDHAQQKHVMGEEILRRLFQTLLTDKRLSDVGALYFWSGGETLLHPQAVKMFKIVQEYKDIFLRKKSRFPTITLLTNGIGLDRQLSEELLDLNVLDLVRFSIDGGSREKYEEIRRGAKWDAIEKNVRDFCGLNMARAKTGAICLIEYGKPCTTDWMTDEFKSLLRLLDHVELRHPHDWIGKDAKVKADGLPQKPFKNSCYSLKHGLTILPNGDVTVCCGDLNGLCVLGNLYQEDLHRIAASKKRKEMIRYMDTGQRDKMDLCRDCKDF